MEETQPEEKSSGWTFQRIIMIAGGAFLIVIILTFVIALIMALTNAGEWSPVIAILRDTTLLALSLTLILIVFALVILLLQIAKFVNLLQNQSKSILDNAKETVLSAKDTVEFVGQNIREPIQQSLAFMAGLGRFIVELFKLWRVVQTPGDPQEGASSNDQSQQENSDD